MRVRVWIAGADGPSHDFELVDPPRIGERVSISASGSMEEGIVADVTWQLLAIERSGSGLALEGEPVGSVTLVHVVCERPGSPGVRHRFAAKHADATPAAADPR